MPGISSSAFAKLSSLRPNFALMPPYDRLAFVEALRLKRSKRPAAKVVVAKEPKPVKVKKIKAAKGAVNDEN